MKTLQLENTLKTMKQGNSISEIFQMNTWTMYNPRYPYGSYIIEIVILEPMTLSNGY